MFGFNSNKSASARIAQTIGIFSGVRVVNILCALVRNKLIAWLIGPAGLGLVMLYNSVVDLITQTTRLSIDQSAQRDVAQSSGAEQTVTVNVLRRWALWLGLLGSAVMCVLSPLLSFWSFDTIEHWPTFCLLAVVPLCLTYCSCVAAANQGLRRFKGVAMATVISSVAGLVVVIPLIIWLKIDSIVWIIVAYGITSWLGAWLYRPRTQKVKLAVREVYNRGRDFVKLGAQITLALFVGQGFNYFFVLYLNTFGSTDVLGIYQSGYTMMNSYIGIVFSALWIEYYPRLSATVHSSTRIATVSSHEARLTLTFLTPLLCGLALLAGPVVSLIYSDAFMPVIPYLVIGCVGVVFKLMSFCQVYIILARGDGKIYLFTEIFSSIVGLIFNIAGFTLWGFYGLGLAYVLWYAVYMAVIAVICRRRYDIGYRKSTWIFAVGSIAAVTLCALLGLAIWA